MELCKWKEGTRGGEGKETKREKTDRRVVVMSGDEVKKQSWERGTREGLVAEEGF